MKNIGYLFESKAQRFGRRILDNGRKAINRIAQTKGYSVLESSVEKYSKHSLQGRLTKRR